MKLANCKKCGKLFKKVLRDVCDVCAAIERHELILIHRFMKETQAPEVTLQEIHGETLISMDHLEEYYFSGLLASAGTRIKANCKICNAEISSITRKGYFCTKCSDKLVEEFGNSSYVDRSPVDITEIKLKKFHKNVFHSQLKKGKGEKYGFKKIKE